MLALLPVGFGSFSLHVVCTGPVLKAVGVGVDKLGHLYKVDESYFFKRLPWKMYDMLQSNVEYSLVSPWEELINKSD